MAYLEWKKEYTVGVPRMDKHHKKLFHIIKELHDGIGAGEVDEILNEIFARLIDYTEYHFTEEVKLLETFKYPQVNDQKIQHNFFISALKDVTHKYLQCERSLSVIMEVQSLLRDWLVNHIMDHDIKYSSFIQGKGAV